MFNRAKLSHDEPAEDVAEVLSIDESDVNLRLKQFQQWLCHTRQGKEISIVLELLPSPFAVRSLWNQQIGLDYVAEAERRRKKGLPAETCKEYLEKSRSESAYPILLSFVILIIVGFFVMDIEWAPRGEAAFWSQEIPCSQLIKKLATNVGLHQKLSQTLKHPSCAHLLLSIFGLIATGYYLEGRHGSTKVAGVSVFATSAAVALGFMFDSNRSAYMSITLSHTLLGMNWADMWISWGMLIEITSLTNHLSPRKGSKQLTNEELCNFQFGHMIMLTNLEILPLTCEMISRP